jgi:hypothetical protein
MPVVLGVVLVGLPYSQSQSQSGSQGGGGKVLEVFALPMALFLL